MLWHADGHGAQIFAEVPAGSGMTYLFHTCRNTVLMTRLRPPSTLRQFTISQSELPEGATSEIGRIRHSDDSAGRLVK